MSARRNPVEILSSGFNRITRLDLRWHPYRRHVRHALLATDFPRRLRFSEWFNQRCRDQNFLESLIIGNEAAFLMNGEVNSHNVRQYAPKGHPPAFNFERNDFRAKLTVWAALCGNGVIFGPYFFDRNVDGIAYLRMLNEFVFPQLDVHFGNQYWEGLFRGLWWAQDGAPAHRLIQVATLKAVFHFNRTVPKRSVFLCLVSFEAELMTLGQKKTLRFGTVWLQWKTGFSLNEVNEVFGSNRVIGLQHNC